MRLLKSLSLASASTVFRLAAALVTFAIVARALGPHGYGLLMLCMSVAALLNIAGNYGLVVFVLREVGRQPMAATAILGQALSAKLIATGAVVVLGLLAAPFLPAQARWAYVMLLPAMLCDGFTEFFLAGFRARQRFDAEARLAVLAGLVNASGVGLVAWWTASLLPIAAAYLCTRVIVTTLTYRQLLNIVGSLRPARWSDGRELLRRARSYAVDSALSSAFGQVDSVVLNYLLGPVAVGLNQAGMRLFMAGSQAANVLANVFLPRAAAAHAAGRAALGSENTQMHLAFLCVGAAFGLTLAAGGNTLVQVLLGPSFAALGPLMPWFGLLFAIRFSGGAWGIVLTTHGLQPFRAGASAVHWLVVAIAAALLVPTRGNVGWLISLVIGNSLLLMLYAGRAAQRSKADARLLILTMFIVAAFVPMLKWS